MKINEQERTAQAETQLEELALADLHQHRPFFAVAEQYIVEAYQRGYEAAIRKYKKLEDAEYLIAELKRKSS